MSKVIVLLNLLCCILHIIFEVMRWNHNEVLNDFILVENALIALVFFYFALRFFHKGLGTVDKLTHLFFWISFTLLTIVIQPQTTTLFIFRDFINIPEWLSLSAFGVLMLVLSVNIFIRKDRNTNE